MSFFLSELRRLTQDLNESGVAWCLVGGLGSSVYAEPRTTKDIDVAIFVSDEDRFTQLRSFLLNRGYIDPQILMHTMPTRRMGWRVCLSTSQGTTLPIDLLSSACGIEEQVVKEAVSVELLPGLSLPVASLGHLLAMKILSQNDTDRIQDRADLLALLRNASEHDIALAKRALRQIEAVGFADGRNLVEELARIVGLA